MSRPKTIAEYIKNQPKEIQSRLQQVRKAVRAGAPGGKEAIKWSMPAISYEWILVMYGSFKSHITFAPTPSVIKAFKKDLTKYKTGKGTVQFAHDKPIPVGLITRMTKLRVKEAKAGSKWM